MHPKCPGAIVGALILTVLASLPALPAGAQTGGNVLVLPHRVVFEGRQRSAEVTLINEGTAPALYRVSFVDLRMTEGGELEEVVEPRPGERPAADLIRYAPRQVRLEPGGAQTVRLMVRKPAGLEPGEYRSHLRFRLVPPPEAGERLDPAPGGDGIDVRLTPIFNVVIPVIVRHGDPSGRVEVAAAELSRPAGGRPTIALNLERRGDASVYGDLTVDYLPEDGEAVQVALVRGLAVYTPNRSRRLDVPLHPPGGLKLAGGRLRISYTGRAEHGEGPLLARTDLPID